jgi:class 3 adenylate cyclase
MLPLFSQALALVSEHGWEQAYQKLVGSLNTGESDELHSVRTFFLGWLAGERGDFPAARERMEELLGSEAGAAWGELGLGFCAMRQRLPAEGHFARAWELAPEGDRDFEAIWRHGRGSDLYHRGEIAAARAEFSRGLELCGGDPFVTGHFLTGRLLDSLGMTWLGSGRFSLAREFFHRALEAKQPRGGGRSDLPGLAVTHGQLGRLYLDWGLLDQAERHFQDDLRLCEQLDDRRGRAQMLDSLARVQLARFEGVANGRKGERLLEEAEGLLEGCLREAVERPDWRIQEGYARVDRARLRLFRQDRAESERDLDRAEGLFAGTGEGDRFAEGLAHVDLQRGWLARLGGDFPEAIRLQLRARDFFDRVHETTYSARAMLEIARTRRDAGEPRPVVTMAYKDALRLAEESRRPRIVGLVEEELREFDPEAHLRAVYARARGRTVDEPTTSLVDARRDTGTVLYFDIQGSTEFARGHDPEEVLLMFNELIFELVREIRTRGGEVSGYRGDGLLALFEGLERGESHAVRAVDAALGIVRVASEANAPRQLLGLSPLVVRVGVATGELCFGNVGTYDKLEYSVVGNAANLGARLEGRARPDMPCVSDQTRELVGNRFRYADDSPRTDDLKGFGPTRYWHVAGKSAGEA